MASSTVGSSTSTGWKRRSSAASFSMCLRYSSSVVAPIMCSSPRASIGLSMLPASIAPSAAPAPTTVCSSSMNSRIRPSAALTSVEHRLEPLLELAAVLRPGDQRRPCRGRRSSCPAAPPARRRARSAGPAPRRSRSCRRPGRRSAPGCSWSCGTGSGSTRRISASRPMTGSSLPGRGVGDQVAAVLLQRLVGDLRHRRGHPLVAADRWSAPARNASRVTPVLVQQPARRRWPRPRRAAR